MYHKYQYHSTLWNSMYPFEMFSNVDHLDTRQQYIIHHMLSIMYHILPLAYQNIESLHSNNIMQKNYLYIYKIIYAFF